MKTLLTSLLCSLFFTAICSATPDVDALVKVGDIAPAFTLATTDGTVVSTDQSKGKLILVNFFATWCPPCMEEMPRMETEVWQKFKDRGLVVVAIAREQPNDLLATFKSTKNFTLPIAGDLKREVYAKYAKQFIPRNFLIGPDGKVLFASSGYNATEFAEMTKLIDVELSKLK